MTDSTANDDPLVPNPTWTGNIQDFFDSGEIACMNAQGINLASYDSVKQHSTDIFEQTKSGNMPLGGTPWSANRVQTFLNWINTGFPMGSGQAGGGSGSQPGETGAGAGAGDDPVVAHPTYLGDIRNFFRPQDIGCMKARGIDLSTYAGVKGHATNIYVQTKSGNMPMGGPRWSANRVQTFFNWIADKFPMGSAPSGSLADVAAPSAAVRLRKNVASLSTDEIATLKAAFQGIMALDPTDQNSYFYLASVHGLPLGFCMHHVGTYNPWHRVYVTRFEDALRSIPGCENVTLPYWDITEPTVPALLSEPPFNAYTVTQDINDPQYQIPYTTVRNTPDEIIAQFKSYKVTQLIDRALPQPLFGDYHNPAGYQQPIIQAHDSAHNSCGDTMSDQDVAAYDPIFWFFHCNWERLFWSWQVLAGATSLSGFTSTLAGDTDWLDLALDPYADTTSEVIPYPEVAYEQLSGGEKPVLKSKFGHIDAAQAFTIPKAPPVSIRVKDIDRMAIPGTFVVHLLADGEEIAKQAFFQPKSPRGCSNCRKQALVSIDFRVEQEEIQGRKLTVAIDVPRLGSKGMGAFPLSSVGNPTINARLLLEEAD